MIPMLYQLSYAGRKLILAMLLRLSNTTSRNLKDRV